MAVLHALFAMSLTAIASATMEIGSGAPTTLDATVLLLGSYDWQPYASEKAPPYTSRCTDMVWRAAKLGSNRIQFVPTHYWRSTLQGSVSSYCWMQDKDTCQPFSPESLESFRAGMRLCFQAASEAGFSIIHITPHLDSGDGGNWTIMSWRNGLVFDPRQRYGGWSYEQIMLRPLAEAAVPFLAPQGPIQQLYFALQGEMGATVMRYPKQYTNLMPVIKSILTSPQGTTEPPLAVTGPIASSSSGLGGILFGGGGLLRTILDRLVTASSGASDSDDDNPTPDAASPAPAPAPQQQQQQQLKQQQSAVTAVIKLGLTFNFVYADGSQSSTTTPVGQLGVSLIGWTIGARPGFGAPEFSASDVSSLIQQCDFIGVSAYASLNGNHFDMSALQNSAFNLFDSFQSFGVDLKGIMHQQNTEFHYVEFGVGGGVSQDGIVPATSSNAASVRPYWGVQGAYSVSHDPWKMPDMAAFRTYFYSTSLAWLKQGGGSTYGVSACFVWCKASWDVLGIYPESTTAEGTYADPDIEAAVTVHNQQICHK